MTTAMVTTSRMTGVHHGVADLGVEPVFLFVIHGHLQGCFRHLPGFLPGPEHVDNEHGKRTLGLFHRPGQGDPLLDGLVQIFVHGFDLGFDIPLPHDAQGADHRDPCVLHAVYFPGKV